MWCGVGSWFGKDLKTCCVNSTTNVLDTRLPPGRRQAATDPFLLAEALVLCEERLCSPPGVVNRTESFLGLFL